MDRVELKREDHLAYLLKGFHKGFSPAHVGLDASRPWLVYWSLQSLDLLGYQLDETDLIRTIETIRQFQVPGEGGFCGGIHSETGHLGHLAPTFASILSLAVLADPRAYNIINRPALRSFLKRLKCSDGSFRMHAIDGEIDVRAVYCAVVAGKLTGCWDEELEEGVVEWIAKCQTWEGGFAGVPGAEAHGGYTYCATAALSLLLLPSITSTEIIRIDNLIYWLTSQQVQEIGGFRGRTHKLVDGCYSFWQAASLECVGAGNLFDALALQRYILLACQECDCVGVGVGVRVGGLKDKPGK